VGVLEEKLADYQTTLINIALKRDDCFHKKSGDCYLDAIELLQLVSLAERVLLKHGIIKGRDY